MGSSKNKVTHQPKVAPGPKKPTYKDGTFSAEWTFKGHHKSSKASDRAEYFMVQWYGYYVGLGGNKKKKNKKWLKVKTKKKISEGKSGKHGYSITRSDYYPTFTAKLANNGKKKAKRIVKMTYRVCAYNGSALDSTKVAGKPKNAYKWSKKATPFEFTVPGKPTVSDISFDDSNRKFSCTVTPAANRSPHERKYTWYNAYHLYNWTKANGEKEKDSGWTSYTEKGDYNKAKGDIAITNDDAKAVSYTFPSDVDNMSVDEYGLILVKARSEGMAGYSNYTEKTYVVSYPAAMAIKKIKSRVDPGKLKWDGSKFVVDDTGVINGNVLINVAKVAEDSYYDPKGRKINLHPIDSIVVEALRNTVINDPVQASLAGGWVTVDSSNGGGRVFTDLYDDARPEAGRHIWYRVITQHGHLERVSSPVKAGGLEWSIGTSSILEATVVDDGANPTGIKIVYGFGNDHMGGTEIEWSKFKNAFLSNDGLSSARQSGEVNSKAVTAEYNTKYGTSFAYTSTFYISGLEPGEKYYLATRRYLAGESSEGYGARTWYKENGSVAPVLFARKPEEVTITVPSVVVSEDLKKGIEVSWDYISGVKQKSYNLYYGVPKRDGQGNIVYEEDGKTAKADWKALKSEETEKAFTALTADDVSRAIDANKITLRVEVSCGGPYASSKKAETRIVIPPSVQVGFEFGPTASFRKIDGVMRAVDTPLILTYEGVGYTELLTTISADGKIDDGPDAELVQYEGDVVYTGVIKGDGSSRQEGRFAIPQDTDLMDVADYTIQVTPLDSSTGLKGETAELHFTVDWGHKASAPDETSYILGDHLAQTASIYPKAPSDAIAGDVCDIYRKTPDGCVLVRSGIEFGSMVTDPFAPFSNTAPLTYRLVTRTANGSLAWRDVYYSVRGHSIRFDWFSLTERRYSLSLPYNLKFTDKWTKQFEGIRDLAGKKAGWWLPGVDRTSDMSTDLVRLDDFETKELVRSLANHTGPVFVRLPNGCAFLANVNVTAFPDEYDQLVQNVTFSAEEISLTPEFEIQNG